ncbi:TetR/AcrR family transcriptional regulator [Ornithinimicrobium faecis]|uniref:TetR/AcrR family transcriptional regulator n=1 Tax=Ornithinimicrobium faecis TaxID=2934158 RepID=UPI0021196379|nr:TetR/AcrR family transcriptional regulator [Ornithinimicrobium sp. HY1745]
MTEGAVGTGRRQRRWQDVHDRLYEAACELFLESDFITTSVDDIAERADVARKTAFNHFPRKRDFIAEWGRRRRQAVRIHLSPEAMARESLESVLRHYFAGLVAVNEQQRALTIRMLRGWRESGGPFDADPHILIDVFGGLIRAAIRRGELPADVDADRLATVLYSAYFGILYDWSEGADDEPPFALGAAYNQLLDVMLHGLQLTEPRS